MQTTMQPIDLYVVPPSPPCRAVIIAAKYMKINVNLIYVDLMKGEQKQDWFVKLNPQHCLPTINDNGFILWESRAIMAYFANCYAPTDSIYPREPSQRAIVDRLLQFDLNVLYRSLGEFLIPIVRKDKVLSNMNPVKGRKVTKTLNYLESILADNAYVAGSYLTLADFSIYCSMAFAEEFQYDFSKFTYINRWYQRLKKDVAEIDQSITYPLKQSLQPPSCVEADQLMFANDFHSTVHSSDSLSNYANNQKNNQMNRKMHNNQTVSCDGTDAITTSSSVSDEDVYNGQQSTMSSGSNLIELLTNTKGMMFNKN